MKNQRGITLIALVITIIVLLILAGVSIAMLTGENGILTRAGDAAFETAFATARENVSNTINEAITEHYGNVYADNGSSVITTAITNELNAKYGSDGTATNDDGGATISYTAGSASDADSDADTATITITFNGKTQTGHVSVIAETAGKISWGPDPSATTD